MVRAKFTVVSKTETPCSGKGNGFSVRLIPVTGGSPENEKFYQYTPAGVVELTTINRAAADQFEVGKSYYLDFEMAK